MIVCEMMRNALKIRLDFQSIVMCKNGYQNYKVRFNETVMILMTMIIIIYLKWAKIIKSNENENEIHIKLKIWLSNLYSMQ